jgi:hypothetical protein
MATYRIGIGSFNLKDGAVGLGTESSGLGNLKVEGTVKTSDLDVTGVSTFTRYAGFAADVVNIIRDTSLTGEHSTLGDIVVGVNSTFTVSSGATVTVGVVESVSIGTHFSPPRGGIEDRPEVPVEGTVRYNRDLRTLEFYNGVDWRQFTVSGARGRQVSSAGHNGIERTKRMDVLEGATGGNAVYFGDASNAVWQAMSCSSETRGLHAGGSQPTQYNTIDYITIASTGNVIDFGDLTQNSTGGVGCASNTRGIFRVGGQGGTYTNAIEYVQINTLGNSLDFGDCITPTSGSGGACASPTRALFLGGYTNPSLIEMSEIQSIQIASTGNAVTFGHLTEKRSHSYGGSNSVRGICAGGTTYHSAPHVDTIDYVTIASFGNAIDFGILSSPRGYMSGRGSATQTRAIMWAGQTNNGWSATCFNGVESVNFSTTGNSVDFGECSILGYGSVASDSHGGLGGY